MAYRPKNYQKFVATAATATLVASSFAPFAYAADFKDVSSKYKDAVDFVVTKGAKGISSTAFGTDANIKRGDAAVLLVKVLGLDTADAPDAGFEDVNSRLAPYINALKDAGITAGKTKTTFAPDAQITRGELAVWIQKGFGLTGTSDLTFTDVNSNYQTAVQALVANGVTTGTSSTTFGTTDNAKRGDYALFLYRADQVGDGEEEDTQAPELLYDGSTSVTVKNGGEFAVPEVTATDNVDEDVEVTHVITDASGKQLSSIDTKVAGTYKITYSATDKAGNKAEELVITVTVEEAAETAIASASAETSKSIKLTFDNPVDTNKAEFVVKKGNSTIGVVDTTWANDSKSAVLELNSKLTEGSYDISVNGLTSSPLTTTVKAENEKVDDVKILSSQLVKTGDNTATVGYQVLNQYGEDITSSSLANSSNFVVTSSAGTASIDNKGTLTVTNPSGLSVDDKIAVTVVNRTTTATGNATLTVVSEARVADVSVSGVYNKDNKTLSEDTMEEDFYLLFDAKDQYGKTVSDIAKLKDDLIFIVSNPSVVDASEDNITNAVEVGTDKKVGIKLTPKAKGQTNITLVSTSTGKSASYTVTVAEGTKIDRVTLSNVEGVVAGGEELLVPIDVIDNKGNAVTDPKKLSGVTFSVTQGNATLESEIVARNNRLYLKTQTANVADNAVGTLVITASTPTSQISTKVIEVKTNAKPVAITGIKSNISKSIYSGQTRGLDWKDFQFADQYGRAYSAAESDDSYSVEAVDATLNGGAVSIQENSNNTGSPNGIVIVGEEKGSELVTFNLLNSTEEVVSSIDERFTTVVQSEFTSYRVDEVGTMYYSEEEGYGKDLNVYGVTSSGQTVKLPDSAYNVYVGDGLTYNGGVLLANTEANIVDNDSSSPEPQTKNVNVRVVIQNTGDELNVNVPVTAAPPTVDTLEFRNLDSDGSLEEGTVASSIDLSAVGGTFALTDLMDNIYIEDQYGVQGEVTGQGENIVITFGDGETTAPIRLTVSNLVNAGGEAPTISNNGSAATTINGLDTGDSFTARVASGNTAATSVKVTITSVGTE